MSHDEPFDLTGYRARLDGESGRGYWRSLEELANAPDFREFLEREFPREASVWGAHMDRRGFLKLMGASLALAGLTACARQPEGKLVPYVDAPEDVIPGKPLFYATALVLGGFAQPLLAESHMGRPTKLEGNPTHPASLGATSAFGQASILDLYDPDRSQAIVRTSQASGRAIVTRDAFLAELLPALSAQKAANGAGLRILTETVTSPTLAAQLLALTAKFPAAKWHAYEPLNRDNAHAGARLAFGINVTPLYHFERADLILSLDADFLQFDPGAVRYARDFADRRRIEGPHSRMNRLVVIESSPTITGAMADHRLPLAPSQMATVAHAIAQQVGAAAGPPTDLAGLPVQAGWVAAMAKDLLAHRGRSLVLAGLEQPPAVHALAHAMNQALGNAGRSVSYHDPIEASPPDQLASLHDLVDDLNAGHVDCLIVLGGNPVYTAPSDLDFADALGHAKFSVHLGRYADETAARCRWHLPEVHTLESWGDARAYDGTVCLLQPLIAPLYAGISAHELLALLVDERNRTGHDVVRDHWQAHHASADFEAFWHRSVHDGWIAGTAAPSRQVSLATGFTPSLPARMANAGLELQFRVDTSVYDGRFANNGWLQELPRPLSKLTWDNAAIVSPATAARLGLSSGDRVILTSHGRRATAPALVMPGQADDTVSVQLGYGRDAGRIGGMVGFDANALRTSRAPWDDVGLQLAKTGETYSLAHTQWHHQMEGRDLVRAGTLGDFARDPHVLQAGDDAPRATLYPDWPSTGNAWAMAIDTSVCTGCNACVVACQAENNIPIVGKEQVAWGREMHWLRVDAYHQGPEANPRTLFQPVPCMHCEDAPCELVCPVAATTHSDEGLNEMTYNRCVGTRYCSNNCPYKVRRFNFLQYADYTTESPKGQRNPDVSVRERGVMEKCTYCVQRINEARIDAELADRPIRDGEVVTACQAACPPRAIAFGNQHDPHSEVAAWKRRPTSYALLARLNTRPRTTYQGTLKNPNPDMERG